MEQIIFLSTRVVLFFCLMTILYVAVLPEEDAPDTF